VIHQLSWWIRTAPEGAPVVHGLTIDVGSAPFFSLPNAVHAHLAELKP